MLFLILFVCCSGHCFILSTFSFSYFFFSLFLIFCSFSSVFLSNYLLLHMSPIHDVSPHWKALATTWLWTLMSFFLISSVFSSTSSILPSKFISITSISFLFSFPPQTWDSTIFLTLREPASVSCMTLGNLQKANEFSCSVYPFICFLIETAILSLHSITSRCLWSTSLFRLGSFDQPFAFYLKTSSASC